jgi:hypothetical protein
MKRYEAAKELGVDPATISRDIAYLVAQSQNYLNSLAKETLPFMYQTSIEGIRDAIKECWRIYESESDEDKSSSRGINMCQKLAALKLIKECNESVFHLIDEGPSIVYVKQLQEKLIQIESRSLR